VSVTEVSGNHETARELAHDICRCWPEDLAALDRCTLPVPTELSSPASQCADNIRVPVLAVCSLGKFSLLLKLMQHRK